MENWLRRRFLGQDHKGKRRAYRPIVESLEDRCLPAPLITGVPFSAIEGIPANNVTVATFTDTDSNVSNYSALIQWGDGVASTGTLTGSPIQRTVVTGSHTYAEAGTYSVTVSITHLESTTSVTTTATVADAPLSAQAVPITAVAAVPSTNILVATFTDNNPQGNLNDYTATITWGDAALSAGTITAGTNGSFSVTASHTYSTQGTFTVSVAINDVDGSKTSVMTTATVQPITTMTMLTVTPSSTTAFGQAVVFTARVSAGTPISVTPTGTVTFNDGATPLGTGTLDSSGAATFTTSTLSTGTHTIAAVYSGDRIFAGSTGTLAQTVNKASTSATVSSSVNPSVFGQSVTFTATIRVTLPGAGTPTGTVQFQIDGTNAGSPANVSTTGGVTTAFLSAASLAVGPHTITANYSGNANFTASSGPPVTQTVKPADTVTIIASAVNPSIFGLPVTFTAAVQAAPPGKGMPTGLVTFRDGRTVLGTAGLDSTATATLTTANLIGGKHSITAVYNSDTNFSSSVSSSIVQTVTVTPNQAFVTALYRTVLERLPDATGFSFWVQQLNSGASRSAVALAFEVSVEHRVIEVDQFYAQIFHRPADVTGRTIWVNALVSGQREAAVVVAFLTSPEYTATHRDNASYISGLYQDLLTHAGDPAGSAYWLDLLQRSVETRGEVALSFLGATEAFTQAIDFYYTNFLGRPADTAGRKGFLDSLQRAKLTSTGLSTVFLASDEFLVRAIMLAGG